MLKKTILQVFLLIFILIICFIFFKTYFKKENDIENDKENDIEQIELKKNNSNKTKLNLIYNIEYKSNNNNANNYTILSEVSELPEKNSDIILMKGVEATINVKNSSPIKIISDSAIFNKITYDTIFSDNILITYDDHLITSQKLDLFFQKNLAIISNDIVYKNLNTALQADMIEINLLSKGLKIFMNDSTKKIKILTLN
jgi:lipopolysaccharide export system protein LptA